MRSLETHPDETWGGAVFREVRRCEVIEGFQNVVSQCIAWSLRADEKYISLLHLYMKGSPNGDIQPCPHLIQHPTPSYEDPERGLSQRKK
jgi:hypothetical protein